MSDVCANMHVLRTSTMTKLYHIPTAQRIRQCSFGNPIFRSSSVHRPRQQKIPPSIATLAQLCKLESELPSGFEESHQQISQNDGHNKGVPGAAPTPPSRGDVFAKQAESDTNVPEGPQEEARDVKLFRDWPRRLRLDGYQVEGRVGGHLQVRVIWRHVDFDVVVGGQAFRGR